YGMGEHPEDTRESKDAKQIENVFGKFNPMVILVPKGDLAREDQLTNELENLDHVKSIISYTNTVGVAIQPEYLDESAKEEFFSDNYSRMTLHTTIDEEGDEAFSFVEDVRRLLVIIMVMIIMRQEKMSPYMI